QAPIAQQKLRPHKTFQSIDNTQKSLEYEKFPEHPRETALPQERVPQQRDDAHERAEKYSKPAEKQPTHRHWNTTNTQGKQKRTNTTETHGFTEPLPHETRPKIPKEPLESKKPSDSQNNFPHQRRTPPVPNKKLADTNFASQEHRRG
ncbi:MAG: hypothetical protein ACTSWF_10460, partial [Candidatus Freyarchaeota archaeon]